MEKRGFTLVEVIVASLILVFTVAGVLLVFSSEKAALERAGRRIQAMDFARQTLEQLKNEVRADTWDTATNDLRIHTEAPQALPGKFGANFAAQRGYVVTAGPAPIADSYRIVTVTVDWSEP